jgi:hypothetical protein
LINQAEKSAAQQWRDIAWNGVRFKIPPTWEIGEIGRQYLLIETIDGPRLEVKWGQVKGKFSPRVQLKRLTASQGHKIRKNLREDSLPPSWEKVLRRFESIGFIWRSGSIGGRGTVLYCPHCRQATVLQFYQAPYNRPIPYASQLLNSFADHTDRTLKKWAVFDIQAQLPSNYLLKTYRFQVGYYKLVFSNQTSTLTLQRWSPADALLMNDGLVGFEKKCLALSSNRSMSIKKRSSNVVDAEDMSHKSILQRLHRRIKRQPFYWRAKVWHEVDKNRILGVRLEGNDSIECQNLKMICSNYETV